MRIESLRDLIAYFPDCDNIGTFDDLNSIEVQLRTRLDHESSEHSDKNLETLSQLSRILGLQGRALEAQQLLDNVKKALLEKGQVLAGRPAIRFHLELGRLLCLQMNLSKAQKEFFQAWTLASESNETFFAIDAALMIAVIQTPKNQSEWLARALNLAQGAQEASAKLWLPYLHVTSGWHLFDVRRFEDALTSFDNALALQSPEDFPRVAVIKWGRARTLRSLQRAEEALAVQFELSAELELQGKMNGHVLLEIAECLQALKKETEAKPYYESAYHQLSKDTWYQDNRAAELSRILRFYKRI